MTHSPIRFPRTRLKIAGKFPESLAPKESETHDSHPRQEIDRSGIREAIDSTGLPPGRASVHDTLFGFVFGFFGVTAAVLASGIGFVTLLLGGSPEGIDNGLLYGLPITVVLAVLFLWLAIFLVRSERQRAKRMATAWKNGWIEYRPALIGELVLHRRRRNDDSTDHFYKAPLLVLQPDGSMPKAHSA